jgi:diguanylate cyclase (GGDEF)-like protein
MASSSITSTLARAVNKLRFGFLLQLRFPPRHILQILAWPLICLGVALLLWAVVVSKLNTDKDFLERNALSHAAALSRALGKGLSLSILDMDEVSQSLQFRREHGERIGDLNQVAKNSVLRRDSVVFVGILDRNGNVQRGDRGAARLPNLASEEYFRFHRADPDRGLRIGTQTFGRVSGQPVLHFSRRVDAADGSFDGVVVLGVRPRYLTSFYDEMSFGQQGYLGIFGKHGELYAAQAGRAGVAPPSPPALDRPSGRYVLRERSPHGEEEVRLVAWQQLTPYPLFVLVGLTESEALTQFRTMAANYLDGAAAATWFLFLSALAGTLASLGLVWRKQQAQEIRAAYRLATEGANEGFYFLRAMKDGSGEIVDFLVEDCNETGAAFGNITRKRMIGLRLSDGPRVSAIIRPVDVARLLQIGRQAMADGLYEDEWEAAPASAFRGLWLYRRLVRVGDGLAVTIRDISAAKAHEKSLLSMAHEDTLTKLPNRHWLMRFLPEALERARRNQDTLALFFIDIDNFKHINDTLGHAAGDALLQVAARRLRSELRPADSLARLGGDEFTLVLEGVDGVRDAGLVAARIVERFRQPIELDAGHALVGTSIGISLFPADGAEVDTLLRHADIAMYAAKAAGKGQYFFYQPEQYERLMARVRGERELELAVREDQFLMHYQPRLSSASGAICGIEALVRWRHPARGMLAPKEFIGLAESSGLIVGLGALVMDKVCHQVASWQALRLPMVPVSFNMSASELNNGDVEQRLALCLARYRLDPAAIEIELTETTILDDKTASLRTLAAIRARGVKFLVDDFGTGYSSLSQLQRLDTDVLKIDQSFTAGLGRTPKAETFFKAMVSMAHALDMGVVAEGVETPQQLRMLQALGCNELQGYYLCPPVGPDAMEALLRKRLLMTPAGALL